MRIFLASSAWKITQAVPDWRRCNCIGVLTADTIVQLSRTKASAKRKDRAQPRLAQPQSAPDEEAEIDAKKRVGEDGIRDPQMGRDRPAEIARQQHGAEHRGAWPGI